MTGAATLEVHVPGEERPRNARALGASACSDLAVIDIDGEGFPVLWLSTEEVRPGLGVYAAGHPSARPSSPRPGVSSRRRPRSARRAGRPSTASSGATPPSTRATPAAPSRPRPAASSGSTTRTTA
ncbi:hypothetical protein [Pseudonocardia sp.]|uniref:hypothetical protein n=1 Tax=Pseudonocardia sp. TaxID=60912 RepID=UPI0039C9D548